MPHNGLPCNLTGMMDYGTTTIAILGGNPLVNRVLGALLQGVGYEIRLLEEDSETGKENLFEDVDLLLLAPTLSDGFRQALVTSMRSTPETASIPILTLSTALQETVKGEPGIVPWPSRIEDLRQEIETLLQPTKVIKAGLLYQEPNAT